MFRSRPSYKFKRGTPGVGFKMASQHGGSAVGDVEVLKSKFSMRSSNFGQIGVRSLRSSNKRSKFSMRSSDFGPVWGAVGWWWVLRSSSSGSESNLCPHPFQGSNTKRVETRVCLTITIWLAILFHKIGEAIKIVVSYSM